jgi:hypothetical protein
MRGEQWTDAVSGEELHRRRAEIDRAMADVVMDARRSNPNAFEPNLRVTPVGAAVAVEAPAPVSRGWIDPRTLEPPLRPGGTAEAAVSAMVDEAFPPSRSELLARIKAQLRGLSAAQRTELLAECEAKGSAGAELKALALEAWR